MPTSTAFVVYVNGRKIVDDAVDPHWTLLQYLRDKLHLCGAKLGCGEGGCGSCTVMVSKYMRRERRIEHLSVNACLAPITSVYGLAVTTVEGIGSTKTKLHPIQERLYKTHGSQCGFCTPGIVMSMYTLLRNSPQPSLQELEDNFQGNLCRCTGYRPILQGLQTFTKEACCKSTTNRCCGAVNGCDKSNGIENGFKNNNGIEDESSHLFDEYEFSSYDPTQEPIFPPELQMTCEYERKSIRFEAKGLVYYRPVTLEDLLILKAKYPNAKISAGNTEIGIEMKLKNNDYPIIISPSSVPELISVNHSDIGITFGAAVTLTNLEKVLTKSMKTYEENKTRVFSAILKMLTLFAGRQIRNVATIGGNLATASPIADLNPLFVAAGAKLYAASISSQEHFVLDQNFFRAYRQTSLKDDQVLVSIFIPFTHDNEFFSGFKQSQRRHDDIAIVNAGIRLVLDTNEPKIRELQLAFGGMAPTTMTATKTAKSLQGRYWEEDTLHDACRLLLEELPLDPSAPGGMIQYRRTLVISFFFKFYLNVWQQLEHHQIKRIPRELRSRSSRTKLGFPKATQVFQLVSKDQRSNDPIGRPEPHQSGAQHATGEAVYVDDIPPAIDELYLAFVTSTEAHAKIKSIDAKKALSLEGVRTFVDAKDLPGKGNWGGAIIEDEEMFASQKVTCHGQIIAAIAATDRDTARKAAKMVYIEYEPLPHIISIEDAIAAGSFYDSCTCTIQTGDVNEAFKTADHVLEGELHIGGQNHFYLETQSCRVVPKGEFGELEVTVASQAPHQVQMAVCKALNLPANRVVVKVKRIGGGFGGKEVRTIFLAVPVAVAAQKSGYPVRFMLDRDDDMVIVGGRHPFLIRYKLGFTSEGKIKALQADLYNNGGHVLDLSDVVMKVALTKVDCGYKLPNLLVTGRVCKTNLPTNTAFRGFGAPQATVWTETMLNDIAAFLHKDPVQVRQLNMYQEGDRAFSNQILTSCTLGRCWQECLDSSDYHSRLEACNNFNKDNRWHKRGIAIIPVKYGMGFPILHLNQGAALVHIYTDGSVMISHGGVEMGQGLNTKMIQVASRTLKILSSRIHIGEMSTDKVPNAVQTAASFSSDLCGMAIMNACNTLLKRLRPIMETNQNDSWDDWVKKAYIDRISLSTTGFYKADCGEYDFKTNSGEAFQYFSYGAACSEVEIDCLTGDHQVIRTDFVMDVGDSLNPAIDIGQIEGAFVQGYGLYTLEQLRYSPDGALLTRGPGNYKIPGFSDIPNTFNVSLLKEASNLKAVYSSKGIGEPPLMGAVSVFIALKDAVAAARKEVGLQGVFRFNSPATAERIRMACDDQFTTQIRASNKEDNTKVPWDIVV